MLDNIQKKYLIDLISNDKEIPEDFKYVLFPNTQKEYELNYAGKMRKEDILANEDGTMPVPLQIDKVFNGDKHASYDDGWRNMIVFGDNLQFLKTVYENKDPLIKDKVKGKVKLIYIDPPFATEDEFKNKTGAKAYSDKKKGAEFVEFLRRRLIIAKEILSDTGSLYIHLDQKMSHYIKIILDEIFDKNSFRNEIIWAYSGGQPPKSDYPRKHDVILRYTKTSNATFNYIYGEYSSSTIKRFDKVDENGMRYKLTYFDGIENKSYMKEGKRLEDVWTISKSSDQKTGFAFNYPTQKPEKLLENIIRTSTNKGDIVLDFFGGSGVTAAVSEKLDRKWITCDIGKLSYFTIQKRMLQIQNSNNLYDTSRKYEKQCRAFYTCSLGIYDLKTASSLEWEKYITFVASLFKVEPEEKEVSGITFEGTKDDYLVKIFDYNKFKDTKINEEYLENLHFHIKSKVESSRVYIIAPYYKFGFIQDYFEIDDTKYYFLKIPYQMIKELHKKDFQKIRQPKSLNNVNMLEETIGFSFNKKPEINSELVISNKDIVIKLNSFKCAESNLEKTNDEKKLNDFDLLSAVFVDKNYNSSEFIMTDFFFYDDIKNDDNTFSIIIPAKNVGKKIMVVYTDIYGNDFSEVLEMEV